MRKRLKDLGLIDEAFKIAVSNDRLYIPVKDGVDVSSFELETCDVLPVSRQRSARIGLNYEVIGDIAIIDRTPDNEAVARELLETRKDVKVVLAAASGVQGQYRLKDLVFIAGEQRTTTVYREYGFSFTLDVSKVYFSPRLATERHRIASLADPSETIVDMFAGIGPFTIMLAKKVNMVIAFEINPIAVEYLKKNIARNHVNNVVVYVGDAKSLAPKSRNVANRVIMNLPHAAFDFLSEALTVLNDGGGTIHYYDVRSEDEFTYAAERVREAVEQRGRTIDSLQLKKVRSYAPHRYIIVLDIRVAAGSNWD
ncbi:MAG: class I SAM-dependent methyltransferase family protein [Euryarchaeota archaeon]|nr:class I SAM-dependent methyltransferase family protein [Euryarchaeota archaeon]